MRVGKFCVHWARSLTLSFCAKSFFSRVSYLIDSGGPPHVRDPSFGPSGPPVH